MTEQELPLLLLLTVTGPDRPGITAEITRILAENEVPLLDVEQVVVRGRLTLCLLVHMDSHNRVLKDLLFAAKELGQDLDFEVLESLKDDSLDKQTRRYAITLLGDPVSARAMHALSRVLATKKANIDWVRRLSEGALSSVEVLITLPDADHHAEALKKELMSALSECDVDVALQRENLTRRSKRLVVFDLDSTLIPVEVIDEMAKMHAVGPEVSNITDLAMNGLFDFSESLKRRVAMLEGLSQERVIELAQSLPLNEGAVELMKVLKGLGYKVGIISGGFDVAALHIKERLGLDFAYANQLEIVDGLLTGRVLQPIIDAAKKAQLLSEIARRENISLEQTVAIGDGANDALMLAKAGLGIAFHAKPQLKKVASTSVSSGGLDRILYLLGMSAKDVEEFLKGP